MRYEITRGLVSLSLLCAVLGCSTAAGEPKEPVGDAVKSVVEQKYHLPTPHQAAVRVVSERAMESALSRYEYHLTHVSTNLASRLPNVSKHYTTWNKRSGTRDDEIGICTLTASSGATAARDGIFYLMGTRTTMMITPETYTKLEEGPGDLSFALAGRIDNRSRTPRILHRLWFVRDNIGMELSCSGDTDLLPVAVAIDDVIRASPGEPLEPGK